MYEIESKKLKRTLLMFIGNTYYNNDLGGVFNIVTSKNTLDTYVLGNIYTCMYVLDLPDAPIYIYIHPHLDSLGHMAT